MQVQPDCRFTQANREARWALGLTIAYLVSWILTAYLSDHQQGITGLPHWFELSCLLLPLLFVLLCWLMISRFYRDISLDNNNAD